MFKISSFRHRQNGQVLIESIVSISLVTVGLLGILTLLSNSIAFNRGVTSRFVATYLAAEGVEVIKNIEDANHTTIPPSAWNRYLDTDGSYELQYDSVPGPGSSLKLLPTEFSSSPLLFDPSTGIYSYISGDPTGFTRTIKILNLSSDEIQVNSIVRWSDKGENKEVNLEDHFFNWR